jgi:nicotinamidase-related amidase
VLVHKYRFSGFHDNELDSVLRNRAITTLLFTGTNTEVCVLATLMDAGFLGYDCILVEDACSTSSPAASTETVTRLVRDLYGFTTTSEDIVNALGE